MSLAFHLLRKCGWWYDGGAPFDPASPACDRADKPRNVVTGLIGGPQAWVRGARAGDWWESTVQNRFPCTLQKRDPGVVSVNLLCSMAGHHMERVTYVMSAWMRSGHGMWADIRKEECGLALNLSQASRGELLSCYHTLSGCVISR